MRRFLTISCIVLALFISGGASLSAPVAHAQAQPGVLSADALAKEASAKKATDLKETMSQGYNGVMAMIMMLFAYLLGIAMLTLDYAVFYTVVKMGAYINQLSAVGVTWTILRDIGNILLIFGFLATGIAVIMNGDWYGGGAKKFLPTLILAAVFINFSLFITEAIIDSGNLFATYFYTQINGGSLPQQSDTAGVLLTPSGETLTASNEGVSNKIMSQLGLQTIYGNARTNTMVFEGAYPFLIGFMGILLFITTAFVMFSLAFILIARFITLLFLIIVSPIAFAGWAVPQLASTSKLWFDTLVRQTITAPVLLLLLYIALRVITDTRFLTGFGVTGPGGAEGAWNGWVANANLPGFAGVLLSFIVAMGLLLAVTYFSKKLGAMGADWATRTAGKLSFGVTALAMRSSAGWGSQLASQAIRTSRIGGTKTGRLLATGFDRGAKATYDVRNTAVAGGLKTVNIDVGGGLKDGYRARQENVVKAHQDYLKSVDTATDNRNVGKTATAMRDKYYANEAHIAAKDAAEDATKGIKTKVEQQKNEIKLLEKEKEENAESKIISPETYRKKLEIETKLDTARKNLEITNDELTKADEVNKELLKQTFKRLETATNDEKDLKTESSKEKKSVKLAYADNIRDSFAGWAIFGSGGTPAAHKIVKDMLKEEKNINLDQLQKYFESGGKFEVPGKADDGEKKPEKPEEK